MTPLISIVVPVFNVENYLGACLDSLQQQTVSDIEIICVDDASTDRSGSLLDSAATRDARVVVLKHPRNRGLSAARNTGIRAARSPWLLFVDSDDIASSHLCERTLAAATQYSADVVIFSYAVFRDGHPPPAEPHAATAVLAERRELLRRPAFAWTKLVRTSLMRTNGIDFPEGLYFEDTPPHWRLVLESKRPVFLDERLVCYRQRAGSVTYRTDWTRADGILIYDSIRDYLVSTGRWAEWKDIFIIEELANFARTHAYYAVANPTLTQRVREETRCRMTTEHWDFILDGEGLSRWERDYLIASGRPIRGSADLGLLLPILRHRLRNPLRWLWHRLRLVSNL